MSVSKSGHQVHDATVNAAEGTRQVAVAAAASQSAVASAEVTFYRAALASAKTNGIGIEPIVSALKSLGTGGA
jgi:hypothetical protein